MKRCLSPLLFLASSLVNLSSGQLQYPVHDDGLNNIVQWDHYSPMINGERLLVWSGEFHYWRIPVPELWLDIMQKVKAAGWNTIAIYAHWYWHAPAPDILNFEHGAHNPELLFEYAKQVGLYILLRPGPYINAESNAGGFPGWVTTGAYGALRNNDTRYHDAWYPYLAAVTKLAAKHQITDGGPVILVQLENEYADQWTDPVSKVPDLPANNYMEELAECVRDNGLNIPTLTNAPNPNGRSWSKDYSNLTSNQDLYGLDSYPQCWSCDEAAECAIYGVYQTFSVNDYRDHFSLMSPTQPSFLPEFQGGSYNPWGGPAGGCLETTGTDFVNVFYRDNLAQRVTMHSVYMTYGGTNWGGLAWDTVGTSYDYSAPIQENRLLSDKYHESRLIALQVRSSPDLTKTELLGNSTAYANSPYIFTTELQNIDSKSSFYFVRHTPSNRTAIDSYKLNISTQSGNFIIPQSFSSLVLNGKESKIIATDYDLTGNRKVIYSTAEILSFSTVNEKSPLLVVWVTSGTTNEILLSGLQGEGEVIRGNVDQKLHGTEVSSNLTTVLLTFTQASSSTSVVKFQDGLRLIILDRTSAYTLYVPSLSTSPSTPPADNVIVTGPYLVRGVSQSGSILALTGDTNGTTILEVYAPPIAKSVTWNGRTIKVAKTSYGSFRATIDPRGPDIKIPTLNTWKVHDNIPEKSPSYDDSLWTLAKNLTTPNPTKPETLPVLWAEDYNIFWGPIIWRGRFSSLSSSLPSGLILKVQGGAAFAYSVYLNGDLVGNWRGALYTNLANLTLSFENATLYSSSNSSTSNVITVVQDMTGKEMREEAVTPRGIINATLIHTTGQAAAKTTGFTSWKVAGTAGHGSHAQNFLLDPVRGTNAEGGFHHERLGWHLPDFTPPPSDSSWSAFSSSTLTVPSYGIKFFHTRFPLDIPDGVDASLAFHMTDSGITKDFRVWVYVNGYQYGRMYSRIGSQTVFPVPPGILNYAGENTLGVVVWAQDEDGAEVGIDLLVEGVQEGGISGLRGIGADLRGVGGEREAYY